VRVLRTAGTVVFDVGGVIVRWRPLVLLQQVLPRLAPDETSARALAQQIFQSFEVGSDWAAFDRGAVQPGALAERIAARTGLQAQDVRTLIDAIPSHLQPKAGALALMRRLKARGHRLCILSNMPAPYADHLEQTHACFAWFDVRVFSARVGHIKPEAAMFGHAQQACALDLGRSVFIDDHLGNIEAAQRLGWQALHFTDAPRCEAALVARGWL
jgi:putative hydrolase of the HAD superfamily